MKILISTDTSCLVNNEFMNKYEISVFPLNVIINGKEYLDGVTINQAQLCKAMRLGKTIKTSTPAYGSIIEYFDNLFNKGYDHIIHFTISSKLSSMYSLFKGIAEENYKDKLTIIDSYGLSSVMLASVFCAFDDLNNGKSVEEIYEKIESRKKDNAVSFVPENLKALKNGGRVSPAIAAIGNTIGIKPVISLLDGALEKDKMVKNVRHALTDKLNQFIINYPIEKYDYSIIQFDCKKAIYVNIYKVVADAIGEENIIEGIAPINVCAHCGPGTVGLVVTPKINGKSLKEFL